MFSTSEVVQYIGGYHEYIGGRGFSTLEGIMSTSGDVHYLWRIHEYIGGVQYIRVFHRN